MTIQEAVQQGTGKLRRPEWDVAHLELYLTRETVPGGSWGEAPPGTGKILHGPWARIYDPASSLALGLAWDYFQERLTAYIHEADFEPWTEPEGYREKWSAMVPAAAPRELPHAH